jgi:hypothetical protein
MSASRNNRMAMALCAMFTLTALNLPSLAYPPDPENAALLYYQAFLALPKVEDPVDTQLRDYADGKTELNKAIEDYVGSCRGAIGLAVAASELRQCDWGLRYSEGFNMLLSHLGQIRGLARVLIAEARVLASKGDYEPAFERCVTVLKMSRHVGDETLISFLVAVAVESMTDNCIGDLLGQIPTDSKTLEQLKKELDALAKKPLSVAKPLETEQEVAVKQMSMARIGELMTAIDPKKSEKEAVDMATKLGGETFLKKCQDHYGKHMDSAISILRSDSPYAKTHQQLTELAQKLEKEPEKNPEAMLTAAVAPGVSKIYGNMIRGRTQSNALRSAVEVYMIKARTKKLPDKLPAGLPKDLFSGEDFEYKKTDAGFLLRCRAKDLDKDTIQEYEFKVPK